MNYELTQSISNQTEHLRIVNENLQIANGELTEVLAKKDKANEELSNVNKKIIEKGKEFEDLVKKGNLTVQEIYTNANSCTDRAFIVLQEAEKLASEITENARVEKEELVRLCTSLQKENERLTSDNIYLSSLNPRLKDENESITIELNKKYRLLDEVNTEIASKQSSKELLDNELAKLGAYLEERKEYVQIEVSAELKKIELPRLLLEQEDRQLDRKKRNLDILKNRFETKFKKLFPTQEVII